jgi:hypothetical protein
MHTVRTCVQAACTSRMHKRERAGSRLELLFVTPLGWAHDRGDAAKGIVLHLFVVAEPITHLQTPLTHELELCVQPPHRRSGKVGHYIPL